MVYLVPGNESDPNETYPSYIGQIERTESNLSEEQKNKMQQRIINFRTGNESTRERMYNEERSIIENSENITTSEIAKLIISKFDKIILEEKSNSN